MDRSSSYVIRGGAAGRERLRLLSEVMREGTEALLDRVCPPPGGSCLDLGCGGGDVSLELASRVGPSGLVVGVDRDEVKVRLAEQEAASYGSVSYVAADALEWDTDMRFDLVYARFLLSHVPRRRELVQRAVRWLKPGGVMAFEDVDFRGHRAEPASVALDRSVEWYTEVVAHLGGDAHLGPKLPLMLASAGLGDVGVRSWQPVAQAGGIKELIWVTLEAIAGPLLGEGLATDEELLAVLEQLRAHAGDPDCLMCGPTVFQAWGRAQKSPGAWPG